MTSTEWYSLTTGQQVNELSDHVAQELDGVDYYTFQDVDAAITGFESAVATVPATVSDIIFEEYEV